MKDENKCAQLFEQDVTLPNIECIELMFNMQKSLQDHLASKGRALDLDKATFKEKVDNITPQLRNLLVESTELIERLPYKEWKTYSDEEKKYFLSNEVKLECWYEIIDMFHFLMNMALLLDIDGKTFVHLYMKKNKENFDRQKRGY